MYSLRMSFWIVPAHLVGGGSLPLGCGDVEAEQQRGGGVDGHGRADPAQRDAVEQRLHVLQAAYRDAHLAHLALGQGVVGVVADLRGQVEGDGEPGLSLLQQVAKAAVGVLSGGVPRVLPHGPHAAPVSAGLHAPGIGELAGEADVFGVVEAPVAQVFRGVERVNGKTAVGLEYGTALRVALHCRGQSFLPPLLLVLAGHTALLPTAFVAPATLALPEHSSYSKCNRNAAQGSTFKDTAPRMLVKWLP